MAEGRVCSRAPDKFCYVCGEFIRTGKNKFSLATSVRMREAYEAYFGMPVRHQDKAWVPHITCEFCKKTLEGWYRGERRAMRFGVPRIWAEPTDHTTDCYFCLAEPSRRRPTRKAHAITSLDIPSSVAPVPHSSELPVPVAPPRERPVDERRNHESSHEDAQDPDYSSASEVNGERDPYYPNQKDVNDLIRSLCLKKAKAELLISKLKQWDLLHKSGQASRQRLRRPRKPRKTTSL
ncbi:uncharacterized protein LOC103282261 [Anolis carolinensis]|uniref:uncharacterized protein LOC103282261 n=1 Tax=Anolis carolinensis TaxID=28377 RepID=UPI00046256A5|nr:PREDICTED: uncharacterized protein LOC103282261 [Anolis carolinensis]|eukprot:XP_008123100.1 PREDICTED: uncharacterized protein LOC103282261 [Anolis carolinensis]